VSVASLDLITTFVRKLIFGYAFLVTQHRPFHRVSEIDTLFVGYHVEGNSTQEDYSAGSKQARVPNTCIRPVGTSI
jgi:hypothetical protein